MVDLSIFRAYDVRGIYGKTLDENIMKRIGEVLGNYISIDSTYDVTGVYVARDNRTSSPSLYDSFIEGCLSSGKNVFALGMMPLTVAAFYTWKTQKYLAYITASHMSKEWNGVKFFTPDGIGFSEKANNDIKKMFTQHFLTSKKIGEIIETGSEKPLEQYKNLLTFKLSPKRKLVIVTDAGNGVADLVLKDLLRRSGHSVFSINSKPDGNFPNRKVDPNEDPLKELRDTVLEKNADIGFAFDGDADRLVVISDKSKKITADQLAFILLKEIYKTEKGSVIANTECSHVIDDAARLFNEKVIRVPVGDTYLMQGVHDHKAVFGIEKSGHACIPVLSPCDDAIAIAYYLSCVLDGRISDLIKDIPQYCFDRTNFKCSDDIKTMVIEKIKKFIQKKYGIEKTTSIDGIRVDFENSWVLIRQSNTEPLIRLTIESKTQEELDKLKVLFTEIIEKYII